MADSNKTDAEKKVGGEIGKMDLYGLLDVEPDAVEKAIVKAYRLYGLFLAFICLYSLLISCKCCLKEHIKILLLLNGHLWFNVGFGFQYFSHQYGLPYSVNLRTTWLVKINTNEIFICLNLYICRILHNTFHMWTLKMIFFLNAINMENT